MKTWKDIQSEVAFEYSMSRQALLYKGSSKGKVAARREAMHRCRVELGMSFPDIGRAFNMHHTTVMHHIGSVRPVARLSLSELRAVVRQQAGIIDAQTKHIAALSASLERFACDS